MNPSESIISMSRSTSRSACGTSLVNETQAIPWVQTMVAAREAQAQRAVTTAVPAGLRMEDAAEGVTAPDADKPEEDEEAEASAEGVAAAQAAPRVAMPSRPTSIPDTGIARIGGSRKWKKTKASARLAAGMRTLGNKRPA